MIQYPNMKYEIFDALRSYFPDNEDILIDCLRFLAGTCKDRKLEWEYRDELRHMGRCPYCGTELQTYVSIERHSEVDYMRDEKMVFDYCPECKEVIDG